jgi:hypothetical protein
MPTTRFARQDPSQIDVQAWGRQKARSRTIMGLRRRLLRRCADAVRAQGLPSMAAAPVLNASGIDELIGERNDVGARDDRTLLVRDIVVFDRT